MEKYGLLSKLSIVVGLAFIYLAVSFYVYETSDNQMKKLGFFPQMFADIGFDGYDSDTWSGPANDTATVILSENQDDIIDIPVTIITNSRDSH